MRLLAISDVHADAVLFGVPRFAEVQSVMQRSVSVAIERQVDRYLFDGDWIDPDSGSSAFRCTRLLIETALALHAAGIPSTWLTGNHCVLEDGSGESVLEPLKALSGAGMKVTVIDRPCWQYLDEDKHAGLALCALPFTAASHTYDPQKFVDDTWDEGARGVIVAGHLSIEGVQPGEETKDMPRGRDVLWPRIDKPNCVLQLAGHYHRRQVHRGIQIIGSPVRFAFGERDNDPGFLVVEVP